MTIDATVTDLPAKEEHGELLIVTGMSGAGRSTVANALEDLGWYVVDNLPPQMLRPLLDLASSAASQIPRVAVVVDVRGRDLFGMLPEIVRSLQNEGRLRVVFLDASDAALVRRFEAVRRPHPLQGEGTLLDGIARERAQLAAVRESADVVIDTSNYNVHQLSSHISDLFSEADAAKHTITIMSFGFKYGSVPDADLQADMRFLPNPYWVPALRSSTGRDAEVREYVLSQPGADSFLNDYTRVVKTIIEGYQRENKSHSVLAVGCTGGKHRSVATVHELAARLANTPGLAIRVKHRDLGRE